MRIVVEDVAASKSSGGVWSVLQDFYLQVKNANDDNEWIFIVSEKSLKSQKNIRVICKEDLKKSWFKRLLFELFYGRCFIKKLQPDIVFSLQNTITLGTGAKRKIVYLHQPIPYQSEKKFSLLKKRERKLFFYQYFIGSIINLTLKIEKPMIVVQTSWMKEKIIERKIASRGRVIVNYPNDLVSIPVGKVCLKHEFFYPATAFIYKNHDLILEAVKILNRRGIHDFKVICTVTKNDLEWTEIPEEIKLIGQISRKDVMEKYKKSVLLFPSYVETYGLPLLEAAKSNTLIFASNTDFSKEVLNGYENAYYFNFNKASELANLMEMFLNNVIKLDTHASYRESDKGTGGSLRSIVLEGVSNV